MRIRLSRFDSPRKASSVLDVAAPSGAVAPVEVEPRLQLEEGSELSLRIVPDDLGEQDVRLVVGNVVVASTTPDRDLAEFRIHFDEDGDLLRCRGRLLQNWVGQADIAFEVGAGNEWRVVCRTRCLVTASKMAHEAFERLCAEIADQSVGLLLDVYGKTYLGLQPERRLGEQAPVTVVQRIGSVVEALEGALRVIAKRPTYRLRVKARRGPALVGQAVTPEMLEEACLDPSLLRRRHDRTVFAERVVQETTVRFDTHENTTIAGFLRFLGMQLGDLGRRIEAEIEARVDRRPLRSSRSGESRVTWWEQEDLPRIRVMERLRDSTALMVRKVEALGRCKFLPRSRVLSSPPAVTQAVRFNSGYRSAFQLIREHLMAFGVEVDDTHLLGRAKTVPVLYEWWCVLQVIRILNRHLDLDQGALLSPFSPFQERPGPRRKLIIELDENQSVDYRDADGRAIRLRYQPRYLSRQATSGITYGLLGTERERTPDITIEVLSESEDPLAEPTFIIVLDAKYTHMSHSQKIGEVRRKYSQIGRFRDGIVLSRQVWALTPSGPPEPDQSQPEWASFCTVDNRGFWSSEFNSASAQVTGAIQVVPGLPPGRMPLESLLLRLLAQAGVRTTV